MPAGRPAKFKEIYIDQVYRMCLLGLTDVQMSDLIGVSEKTFNTWKHVYPKFLQSIKNGKEIADTEVAVSLRKRAIGYSHPEDKIFCTDGEVTIVPTIKNYPPDTAAAFIWLKNRQPAFWTDRKTVEHSGNLQITAIEHTIVETKNTDSTDI